MVFHQNYSIVRCTKNVSVMIYLPAARLSVLALVSRRAKESILHFIKEKSENEMMWTCRKHGAKYILLICCTRYKGFIGDIAVRS